MLRNVYSFITGGSIAAPTGVAIAIVLLVAVPLPQAVKAAVLTVVAVATLAASTYEKVQ